MKKLIGTLMVLALAAGVSFGDAATAAVNTPKKSGVLQNFGVYTNTRIWAGTMVALNSSGYAVPAADTSGYIVVGRANKTVDNRDGNASGLASSSGAQTIEVERGVFGWTGRGISNDTAVGSICYVSDDNSVTNGTGDNSIIAGVVVDYSDGKVWVDTFNIGRTAGSFTTLAASGAVTLGSTMAVSGNSTLGGTLGVTGVATLTATPRLNAARGEAGTVLLAIHNAPAGTTTNALWVPVNVGGTNCWIAAYPQQ